MNQSIRRFFQAAVLFAAAIVLLAGCSDFFSGKRPGGSGVSASDTSSEETYVSPYGGELGTAGSLTGRSLLISIFTDDAGTSWSDSEEDRAMIDDTLDNLRISTEYLTGQAAAYGSDAAFIGDWKQYPELYYTAVFSENLVTEYGDMYNVQKDWIESNVRTEELKERFRADNVIYLFFFNTDYTNQVNPWYLGYSCSPDYYIEFCNIFVRFDDIFVTKPPSYAHEMMHCFGAHDLYYANEFIPQEYVEYLMNTYSNDIMYTVADSKDIPNDFTALDAYYVGILDDCEEVSQWGLARSEHENDIPITQED